MSRRALEIPIEPKILQWARESIGREIRDIAKRLKLSEETVAHWESGIKVPPLAQLEKLSSLYKRPLAVFFLPEPPKEPPPPEDFRTLPADQRKPFSPATRLAIRRASRLQSVAAELTANLNRETAPKLLKVRLSDQPETVAGKVREQLNVTLQTQLRWKDESEALTEWRKALERLGILVLQVAMPLDDDVRAFSVPNPKFPTIVLNLRDALNGKIFSLFHEYAHLMLEGGGICDMREEDNNNHDAKGVEAFCNHVAGAILVPKPHLLIHRLVEGKNVLDRWSEETLTQIAEDFKVSSEVILRRLVICGLASRELYKKWREDWKEKAKRWQEKRPFVKVSQSKKCLRENGAPFVSLVLDSHRAGKITYPDVADYLAIRVQHLPKVERLLTGNP